MKLDLRDWVSLALIQLFPCLQVICITCTGPMRRRTSTPSPGRGGPLTSPWRGATPPPERKPPRPTRRQVDPPSPPPTSTATAPLQNNDTHGSPGSCCVQLVCPICGSMSSPVSCVTVSLSVPFRILLGPTVTVCPRQRVHRQAHSTAAS